MVGAGAYGEEPEKSSSPLFPHLPGRCGVAAATTDTVLAGYAFCPRTADSDGAPYRCRDQRKQRTWNGEAERLRGLQIDEQLILGRRLHRHIGGLFTLEDAIDVASRAAERIDRVRSVRDETTSSYEITPPVDGWQFVLGRKPDDQRAIIDR